MGAMQQAANGRNFITRMQDIPAVLAQLRIWNQTPKHPLFGRLNLEIVGMSGHSFGARTTQAVAGQTFPFVGKKHTLPEIRAAIMFSPSSPRRGNPKRAFGEVTIPWLLMTGTKDIGKIGGATLESRLAVRNRKRTMKRNPNHHPAILAISTAFWDTYLRNDRAAKAWLTGSGPRSVLEERDSWRTK